MCFNLHVLDNEFIGSTTIGRKRIGRTKIGRRQLGEATISRYENWSCSVLVESSSERERQRARRHTGTFSVI